MTQEFRREQLTADIISAIQSGTSLVLGVSGDVQKLHLVSERLCQRSTWPNFPVGTQISEKMVVQNSPCTPHLVRDSLPALPDSASAVVVTEVDLLFEPTFNLDPASLFRQISRYTPLVVFWPGRYRNNVLSYAVPEHAHYRTWRMQDTEIQIVLIQ